MQLSLFGQSYTLAVPSLSRMLLGAADPGINQSAGGESSDGVDHPAHTGLLTYRGVNYIL